MELNPHRPPVEIFADPITKVYSDIVDQLLVNIARKFNVTDKTVGSTEWQFQQLAKMGQLTKENLAIIATMTGQNVELMQEALERSAMAALDEIEPQFAEAVKKGFLHDAPMSDGVKSVLTAYQSQAIDKLNLVNTTMLQSSQAAFKKAVSSTGIYTQQFMNEEQAKVAQQALNTATGSVATGAESRTAAVRKALKEMSDAGITGFVDKSGKQWSAEAYVNMDVRTTTGNVATEAAFARNRDYGNDLIWWPILATARPGCYPYQGKVCSTSGRSGTVEDLDGNTVSFIPLSSTTYGEPAGIGGINCHHKPPNIFIPGFSKVRGTVPPESVNDKRYEVSQKQRQLEREVRYAKRDAAIADATKDKELFADQSRRVKAAQAKMNAFVDKNGLTVRPDRTQVPQYNKSVAAKAKGVKP